MFGNHGLGDLLEEGGHGKSPKCLGGNLGDLGGFCKGLNISNSLQQKPPSLKAVFYCISPIMSLVR